MGEVHYGIPVELARRLAAELRLTAAVETGTYLGDTTVALSHLAPEVWTIELSEEYHRRAARRLGGDPRIHALRGSSVELLPVVAGRLPEPALYWLDAHWCALGTAGAEAQCPLLAEIAAIDAAPAGARSCLLIDDARLFLGGAPPPYRASDWPSFLEVVDALRSRHDRFVTVLLDVIIAGPPEARTVVESYWRERCRREERTRDRSPTGRLRALVRRTLPAGAHAALRRRLRRWSH